MKISIQNLLKSNPFRSTRDIADKLHGGISHQTVMRYLTKAGFRLKRPCTGMLLSQTNIDDRLHFAESYLKSPYSGHLIFEDESTIWLHDNDHPGWFHKDHQNKLSINRHSGKVNVAAVISLFGKVFVRCFRNNLNSTLYSDILMNDLIPAANRLYPFGWVLAEDNSPCHKGIAAEVLDKQNIIPLDWPVNSPDINPIENSWPVLKVNVRKRLPSCLSVLQNVIEDVWKKLDDLMVSHLCETFDKRVRLLKTSKGNKLDY